MSVQPPPLPGRPSSSNWERATLEKLALAAINEQHHCFREVRGQGLLIGAVLTDAYQGKAKTFVEAGIDEGVLVLVAGGSVVRFAPALNLSREEFDLGMQRFARAVARVVGG